MKYKYGVTAIFPMLNEEKRIYNTLKCFSWCDQIIVLDKGSKDDSIEIALKFKNVKIVQKDFKNSKNSFLDEGLFLTSHIKTNWYINITASDIITKALSLEIKKLVKIDLGDYNCITIPYKPYFMGINETFSPWYCKMRTYIFKTEELKLNNSVHGVLSMSSKPKHYKIIMNDNKEALYHLTHENYEGVLNRYYRYLIEEKNDDISLSNQLKYIVRQIIKLVLFKRVLFRGKAAIALTFSFLSYHMLKYVVLWDSRNGNGINTYSKIREKISDEWN
jgi:hypothetical protein